MCDRPAPETLLDLTKEKVVVLDEDGIYRYLNAAVFDLLGFEPDELVGTDAFALVHPEDEGWLRDAFDAIVAGEREAIDPLEFRYGTADGEWIWLRTAVHVPAETGLEGYVLTSRDVTLEIESQRRLETIASVTGDVLWMFSADWSELLFVNDAVETVFDVSVEEIDRRPQRFLDAVHSDDRPYVERAMDRLSDGESTLLDYRIETVTGPIKWIRVPGEPVIENDEVIAVTGLARDVTEEYRRKRQLAVMDNLLRHTIRNDMNIVDGTAERIADRVEADLGKRHDHADEILEHAATIRRVADDLLTTAEKQRGVIELLRHRGSPRPIEIEPVVENAAEMAVDDLGRSTPEVSVSCESDVLAFTHPELDYAIAELVANALEHAESTPAVRVTVTESDEVVEISIRDNCSPIPPEQRSAMADRWEMDDLHHPEGMGLWLVYWVADRSGGDLAFDTHDDGNVVTLTVPNAEYETPIDPDRTHKERRRRTARHTDDTARGRRTDRHDDEQI